MAQAATLWLFVCSYFFNNQPNVNCVFCTRAAPPAAGSSTAHPSLAADGLAGSLTALWPSVSPSALQPPLLWGLLKWDVSRWRGGSGGCWWCLYIHTHLSECPPVPSCSDFWTSACQAGEEVLFLAWGWQDSATSLLQRRCQQQKLDVLWEVQHHGLLNKPIRATWVC